LSLYPGAKWKFGLGKQNWLFVCLSPLLRSLLWKNETVLNARRINHDKHILWHRDKLLGNDRETNNKTMVIARQQLRKWAIILQPLLGSGSRATTEVALEAVFSIGPLRGYITRPTELV
jgi:hypothetical protein